MSVTLHESAYAKLNLTLDVLDRRPDGYHNIRSVMQTISIRDDIQLEVEILHDNPSNLRVTNHIDNSTPN